MATDHLQIPDIAASQNNKEVTANEAHNDLDNAINDNVSKAITVDASFTTVETRENGFIELTGTPGTPRNIDMPDGNKRNLTVLNSTDDVMTIRNSASGGSNQQVIGIGKTKEFFYDGVNFKDGSGGSTLSTEDEGSEQEADTTVMNFVGGGVIVTNPVTGEVTVTVDGGPDASGFLTRNELLHITHEVADGGSGGTSVTDTWNTRPINNIKTNEISGASLTANQITLPAGTYYIEAHSYVFEADHNKLRLRNITDSTSILIGINQFASSTDNDNKIASLHGRFVLSATKTLEIQHFTQSGFATSGLGFATTDTEVEVYADITIWRDPGVSSKPPVRFATVVNGADATAFEDGDTVDGVTLVTGDRFLRKNQTTGSENGIYVVNATGAPTRASDLDADEDVGLGVTIPVLLGTENAETVWMHVSGAVIDTDALVFERVGADRKDKYVDAEHMIASAGSPVLATVSLTAGQPVIRAFDFDQSAAEAVQFALPMPREWDLGTIDVELYWSHPAAATFDVRWGVAAVSVADDGAIDVAFGTQGLVTDSGGTTDDQFAALITGITVGGTPARGDMVYFEIERLAAEGADTLDADARLQGVRIIHNEK